MERKVLIVDDELSVLKALERALRKEGYGLLTAESGEHALELLSGYKVAVILSDINMPGMNGIEFLSRAQQVSPDSIKMVLSGYADIDLVMDAINHGHVWRYLTKPWQPEDVRVAIDNAMGLYDVRAERESLLTALEIKNQQLVKWSNKLEDMVDRRTEHIQNELMLMTCLMEGCDLECFCSKVMPLYEELFGTADVSLFSAADGVCYNRFGIVNKDQCQCADILAQVQQDKQLIADKDQVMIPVLNNDMLLGALCIRNHAVSLDDIGQDYESYMAITSIAMLHNLMKVNTPDMIRNIEKVLQEIE